MSNWSKTQSSVKKNAKKVRYEMYQQQRKQQLMEKFNQTASVYLGDLNGSK